MSARRLWFGAAFLAISLLAGLTIAPPSPIARADGDGNELELPLLSVLDNRKVGEIELNLASGNLEISVDHAQPSTQYVAVFVGYTGSLTLGILSTDSNGDGELETTIPDGQYSGRFALQLGGQSQFTTAVASFAVGVATQSTTTTTTSRTETTVGEISVVVEPPSRSVVAGHSARFTVQVTSHEDETVFLSIRNVPVGAVAVFTPSFGKPKPMLLSILTVITTTETPSGLYTLTILITTEDKEFATDVALQVTGGVTVTTTTTAGTTTQAALSVSVLTDRATYNANQTVSIEGQVKDSSQNSVGGASVSLQVVNSNGATIYIESLATNNAGFYHATFKLSSDAIPGTYTVFVTVTKEGFIGAANHTSFVVGTSTSPSVVISEIFTGDSAGNVKVEFAKGETVFVWVVIQNTGADLANGVIWVQVQDPNGVAISIQIQITTIATGQTIQFAFGMPLPGSAPSGTFKVSAFVSNRMISQGGSFLASGRTQFAVTQ